MYSPSSNLFNLPRCSITVSSFSSPAPATDAKFLDGELGSVASSPSVLLSLTAGAGVETEEVEPKGCKEAPNFGASPEGCTTGDLPNTNDEEDEADGVVAPKENVGADLVLVPPKTEAEVVDAPAATEGDELVPKEKLVPAPAGVLGFPTLKLKLLVVLAAGDVPALAPKDSCG